MISRDEFQQPSERADKVRGVHLAIVVENKDETRPFLVKLKYPWLPGDEKTYWARVAMPMGGPDRGTYLLPEKDDQVLVVFVHGDIERPVVIGSLWNQKQMPPESNADGKNDVKVIKSRSGHRIIFDDTNGSERVIVVDSTKKNKVSLDVKEKTTSIECSGDITIKAKAKVLIHGKSVQMTSKDGDTTIKSGADQKIETAGALDVKASGTITIEGSQVNLNMGAASAQGGKGGSAGAGQKGSAAVDQVKEAKGG
ncbi:MAG: hypothetical protein F9K40_12960, partial [Kofleriaceae bacterium]